MERGREAHIHTHIPMERATARGSRTDAHIERLGHVHTPQADGLRRGVRLRRGRPAQVAHSLFSRTHALSLALPRTNASFSRIPSIPRSPLTYPLTDPNVFFSGGPTELAVDCSADPWSPKCHPVSMMDMIDKVSTLAHACARHTHTFTHNKMRTHARQSTGRGTNAIAQRCRPRPSHAALKCLCACVRLCLTPGGTPGAEQRDRAAQAQDAAARGRVRRDD